MSLACWLCDAQCQMDWLKRGEILHALSFNHICGSSGSNGEAQAANH